MLLWLPGEDGIGEGRKMKMKKMGLKKECKRSVFGENMGRSGAEFGLPLMEGDGVDVLPD